MLKTLVMDFLAFKPEFSRRLSRIFFSASSRLSRNFRGRLAGLAQIAAAGRLSRRLRGLPYSSQKDSMECKLSWRTPVLFNFNGQMLDRLLLKIRPVTENGHSTGTDRYCRHAKKQCSKLL